MDGPGLEVHFARSEHERDEAEDVVVGALGGAVLRRCAAAKNDPTRTRCRPEPDLSLSG
jgi:hypothetical protein